MADDTVDMDGLEAAHFWLTWDVAAACGVELRDAYRALVDCGWNVEAAQAKLGAKHDD